VPAGQVVNWLIGDNPQQSNPQGLKNYIFDKVEKLNTISGIKNAVLKNVKD
jgi:hypothetical protein